MEKVVKCKCFNCICLKILVHYRAAGNLFNFKWLVRTCSGPEDPLGIILKFELMCLTLGKQVFFFKAMSKRELGELVVEMAHASSNLLFCASSTV